MTSCPLCQSALPPDAPACPFCGTVVGPPQGSNPAGHKQALRALQLAQDAMHDAEGKGVDLGVAKGLMERARIAMAEGSHRQAEDLAAAARRAVLLAQRRSRMDRAIEALRAKVEVVKHLGGPQDELLRAIGDADAAIKLGDFRAAASLVERTTISLETYLTYARGRALLEEARGKLKEGVERGVDVAPLRPFLQQAEEALQENNAEAVERALRVLDRAMDFATRKARAEKRLERLEQEIRGMVGLGIDTAQAAELVARARKALKSGLYADVERLTREAQAALQGTRGRSRIERSLARTATRLAELEGLGASVGEARKLLEEAGSLAQGGDARGAQGKVRLATEALARAAEDRRRQSLVEEVEVELKDLKEMGAETGAVEEALAAARKALEAGDVGPLRAACEAAWRAAQVARRNRERQILLVAAEKIVDRVGSGGVSALGAKELLAEVRRHIGSGKVGDLEQVLEAKFNAEVLRKEKEVLQSMAVLERLAASLREAGIDGSMVEAGLARAREALEKRKPWDAEQILRSLDEETHSVREALHRGAAEALARAREGVQALEASGFALPEARELLARAEAEVVAGADDRALGLAKLVLGVVERTKREHFDELARREVEKLKSDEVARGAAARLKALGEVEQRLRESGVPTDGLRSAMEKAQAGLQAGRFADVEYQLNLGEGLGRGMEDSLHRLASDIIAKAEEALAATAKEGVALPEGQEALRAARDALAAHRYDAAARFAQRAVQAVDAARHRLQSEALERQQKATQDIRDHFARVGALLEELKKAGIDISGGEDNLAEAARAIQVNQLDQATEILHDMEDMGQSLRASFKAAAQEFITRATTAIETSERMNLPAPEAREMEENAKRAFQEGLFDRAVELSKLAERRAKTSMRTAMDEAEAQVKKRVEAAQGRIRRLRKVMKDLSRADIAIEGAEEALGAAEESVGEGDFDGVGPHLEPVEEMAQGLAAGLKVAAKDLLARTHEDMLKAKAEGLALPRGEQVMNTAQSAWEEERYVEALEYCKVIEDIIQDVRRKRQGQDVLATLQGLRAEASALRGMTKLPPEVEDYLLEAVEEAQGGDVGRAKDLGDRVARSLEKARGELRTSLGLELEALAGRMEAVAKDDPAAQALALARGALADGDLREAQVHLGELRDQVEAKAQRRLREDLTRQAEDLGARIARARATGVGVAALEDSLAFLSSNLDRAPPADTQRALGDLARGLADAEARYAETHRPEVEVEAAGTPPQAGGWNAYGLRLQNRGTAAAQALRILARGPGEFRFPAEVPTLAPGGEVGLDLGWHPSAPGEAPLEVQVEYEGPIGGERRRISRDFRVVVRPSGTYLLDDVFLVHGDGRLIHHAGRKYREAVDEDIFSGMLTIVQDFVRDSFHQPTGVGLKRLEFGDSKIIIERGAHIYLAAVLSGSEPGLLPLYMAEVIRDLEVRYGGILEHWTGLMGDLQGIDRAVEGLLELSSQEPNPALGQGTVKRALEAIEGMRALGADTTEAEELLRRAEERIASEGATGLALVEAAIEGALRAQRALEDRIAATLEGFRGSLEDLKALGQETTSVESQVRGASDALRAGDLATAGRILQSLEGAMEGLKGSTVVQRVAEQVERLSVRLESLGQGDPSLDPVRRDLEALRIKVTKGDLKGLGPQLEALAQTIDERQRERRLGEVEGGLAKVEESVGQLKDLGVVTEAVEATLAGARQALARGEVEETENLLAVAQEGLKGVRAEVLRDHQPRVFVRTQAGTMEAGKWNRVTVELANRGNWPARDIQVQFQGDVEVQGLEPLAELGPNEVRQLEVGVRPRRDGSVPVDLEVAYGRTLDEARYAVRDARDLAVERPGTYAIEAIFLFLLDGRLVAHEGSQYREQSNAEDFTKMVQGLETFLGDAFRQKRAGGLRRMEVGGHKVLVERGPREYVAAVVDGEPPSLLPLYMVETLNEVEVRFGPRLAEWDGHVPEGLPAVLRRLLFVTDVTGADLGDLQDSPISALAATGGPAHPGLAQAAAMVEQAEFGEALGVLRGATGNVARAEDITDEVKRRALAAAQEGFNVQVDDASLRNYIDLLKKIDRTVRKARAKANLDPAIPVRKVAIRTVTEELANAVRGFGSVIMHQCNTKELDVVRPGEIWRGLGLKMEINGEAIGRAYKGVWAKKIELILRSQDPWKIRTGVEKGQYSLGVEGMTIKISPDMVSFTPVLPPHVIIQDFDSGIVYLDTQVTPEILAEVASREILRLVHTARGELGLASDAPLAITVEGSAALVRALGPERENLAKGAHASSVVVTTHADVQEGLAAEAQALGERFSLILIPPESSPGNPRGVPDPPPPPDGEGDAKG